MPASCRLFLKIYIIIYFILNIVNNKLHKVTYDHTLVNLLLTAGELTKEEASCHPKKNVLMKALGANDPIDIDIFE